MLDAKNTEEGGKQGVKYTLLPLCFVFIKAKPIPESLKKIMRMIENC